MIKRIIKMIKSTIKVIKMMMMMARYDIDMMTTYYDDDHYRMISHHC